MQAGRLPDTFGWCDTVKVAGDYVADVEAVVDGVAAEKGVGGMEVVGEMVAETGDGAGERKLWGRPSYVLGLLSLLAVGLPWARGWVVGA